MRKAISKVLNKHVTTILGWAIIATAAGVFYGVFFKLAPTLAAAIPAGTWAPFLKIVVYVILGYVGGIGLPIGLLIWGILILLFTR